jgi:hypothetical protein
MSIIIFIKLIYFQMESINVISLIEEVILHTRTERSAIDWLRNNKLIKSDDCFCPRCESHLEEIVDSSRIDGSRFLCPSWSLKLQSDITLSFRYENSYCLITCVLLNYFLNNLTAAEACELLNYRNLCNKYISIC